jgi:hypothetical protein
LLQRAQHLHMSHSYNLRWTPHSSTHSLISFLHPLINYVLEIPNAPIPGILTLTNTLPCP